MIKRKNEKKILESPSKTKINQIKPKKISDSPTSLMRFNLIYSKSEN